ncbi:MAG TPA: PAS domain S-box protein, partial [Limnobacter sp.]|nr:PAS domain S-box protein [Limnobacter sp.]
MIKTKSRYHWVVLGGTLLLLGFALLAYALLDLRQIDKTAREDNQTQLRLMHDILQDEFNATIRSFNEATFQLSDRIGENNIYLIQNRLELLKSALPAMETIVARNPNGDVVAQTGQDNELINTQAIFPSPPRSAHNPRLLSFSQSFSPDRKLVLVVNYQVESSNSKVLGWIQGRFSADYIAKRIAALRIASNMRSGLVFEDGMLMLMTPEVPEMVGKTLTYYDQAELEPGQLAASLPAYSPFHDSHFGSLRLSTTDPLNSALPIYLVSWADTGPQKEQWREGVYLALLGYLILCAFAVFSLRQFLRRQSRQELEAARALTLQQLNDERFKLATESAGIGVWEYGLDTQLVQWDSAMCRIYGVLEGPKSIPCSEWLKHVLPNDAGKLAHVLAEAQSHGETLHFQFSIRRANDGRTRHIQARAKTYRNAEGVPFRMIGVNVDITVQRQFEDALREAEDRFRSSFEWAAIGMAMLDYKGKFLQVNKALSDILGYSERELLGFTFDAITHPQDTRQHVHLVREVLKGTRQSYQLEKRYIHKEGHVVWAHLSVSAVRDDKGRVTYFISQIQDITERKRNEATLIEREHFLRTLSECLPGLVSYWSTDLRCHFANRNHEKWTGIAADRMRGQHMRKLLGDELFEHDQDYVTGVLRGERQRFERRKPLPSGGYADLLVHLVPDVLYGKVEGFFSISTNITDFKAQQRELEKANTELVERTQQAEAASKAKGAFLANMSHEIRTPMNAIMGLLQLLEDTDLQARQRDYLSKIGSAADVLLHVLNDILDISRVEANRLELSSQRFLLDEVLSKTTDLFAYRAEEKAIQLY